MIRTITISIIIAAFSFTFISLTFAQGQDDGPEWHPDLTNNWIPVEDSVYTGSLGDPPSDAIVLFDGSDLSQWESAPGYYTDVQAVPNYLDQLAGDRDPAEWTVENGTMTVEPGTGSIMTKQSFGDVQLHIEWKTPEEIDGDGQGRGNSGVAMAVQFK